MFEASKPCAGFAYQKDHFGSNPPRIFNMNKTKKKEIFGTSEKKKQGIS